jgi:hypothetical protein
MLEAKSVEPEKIDLFYVYALRLLVGNTFPVPEKNFRFGE